MSLAFADISTENRWDSPGTAASANPRTPWAASWFPADRAASWFPAASKRLEEIRRLKRGWNSYGAVPVNAAVAHGVSALLQLLDEKGFRQPSVSPTARGGITLEWSHSSAGVEISFEFESITILIDRDGEIYEDQQSLTRADSLLARALAVVHGW
jgi:hypothetical protein